VVADGSSQVDDAVMAQLMGLGFSAQKAGKVILNIYYIKKSFYCL